MAPLLLRPQHPPVFCLCRALAARHFGQSATARAATALSQGPSEDEYDGPDSERPRRQRAGAIESKKSYKSWLLGEARIWRDPDDGKTNWLGNDVPFPTNPSFRPAPPVSDATRTAMYRAHLQNPGDTTVRSLSAEYGLSLQRVEAILKLKRLEDEWSEVRTFPKLRCWHRPSFFDERNDNSMYYETHTWFKTIISSLSELARGLFGTKVRILTSSSWTLCQQANRPLQQAFLQGMESALGVQTRPSVAQKEEMKGALGRGSALDEDAAARAAAHQTSKMTRIIWEMVGEGDQPIIATMMEEREQAKARMVSRPKPIPVTFPASKPGRPGWAFVDVGDKYANTRLPQQKKRGRHKEEPVKAKRPASSDGARLLVRRS